MKHPFIPIATILIATALAFADDPATAPTTQPVVAPPLSGPLGTPIELFNGKDLSNWTWVAKPPKKGAPATQPVTIDDVFSVENGILHDKGKPTGYIRTTAAYDNYELIVEQLHTKKGNGGVLFAMSGPDKVWPHCIEAQGQNGEEGDFRNVADFKMTMDPARLEPKRLRRLGPDPEKPPGQWETFKIIVDHGNVVLYINDSLQNIATNAEGMKGQIGLQAEGGDMLFRKVELIPIGN